MTTAEYLRTPESLIPTELIYGTLRVAESPLPRHQAVVLDMVGRSPHSPRLSLPHWRLHPGYPRQEGRLPECVHHDLSS